MKHLVTFSTNQPLEAAAEFRVGVRSVPYLADHGFDDMVAARVWRDIASKRRATNYLRCPPLLVAPVLAHDQVRSN